MCIRDRQEELLAHYNKGTYIIAVEEDGKIPILKQKDGSIYQPVFTDMLECKKLCRGKKMKVLAIPAAKIAEILVPDAKGVAVNPFGVNVQLQVVRPQKKETSPTA